MNLTDIYMQLDLEFILSYHFKHSKESVWNQRYYCNTHIQYLIDESIRFLIKENSNKL